MSKWYQGIGNNSDVVLFSKVRLARNLEDAPFPSRMSTDIKKAVSKRLYATIKSSPLANEFDLVNMNDVTDVRAASYVEKGLISRAFFDSRQNSSFLLSKREDLSIMLCEEDHLRICSFVAGDDIASAYRAADQVDDIILSNQRIAFSQELGFLTASPVNLGTGMKATFALHLPALAERNAIYALTSMVGKLGLSLREMYKGGLGDIYLLSNQISLGITEQSALDNLKAICDQIVARERNAREELRTAPDFEDRVFRTLGVLRMARRLDKEEFFSSLSLVRLGISLAYFDYTYDRIGDMIYTLQDATLMDSSGANIDPSTCAKLRADIVREMFE